MIAEFTRTSTTGFERDEDFVQIAKTNMPELEFKQVETLAQLPALDARFDLVFSFTVLQHVRDIAVNEVIEELKRVACSTILICEETDPTWRDSTTTGRSINTYTELFKPFRLVYKSQRDQEPNCPSKNPGHYMVFEKP